MPHRCALHAFKAAAQAAIDTRDNFGHYQPPATVRGRSNEPEAAGGGEQGYLLPDSQAADEGIAGRVAAWAADAGQALQRALKGGGR